MRVANCGLRHRSQPSRVRPDSRLHGFQSSHRMTMSHTTDPHVGNSSLVAGDLNAEITYRPISRTAIAGLVLGLLSPLASFWNVLWLLPLMGVLMSAAALHAIRRSEGILAGRGIALIGLTLSLAMGAMVIAGQVARKNLTVAQGTPWAVKWCELLLEGRTEEALELEQPPSTRRSFAMLEQYYQENDAAQERLAEFRAHPLVVLLTSAPDGSEIKIGKVRGVERRSTGELALVRYFELHPPQTDESDSTPVRFLLEVDKTPKRGAVARGWYVKAYQLADQVGGPPR